MGRFLALVTAALSIAACATPADYQRAGDAALAARSYREAAQNYRAALARLPGDPAFDDQRLHSLYGLGTTSVDSAEAVLAYRTGLTILERRHAPAEERARLMMGLGARLRQSGRCEEARDILESSVALYRDSQQPPASGVLLNLANVNLDCGDLAEARRSYEVILAESSEHWMRSRALLGLASVHLAEGDLERASDEIVDALTESAMEVGPDYRTLVRLLDLQTCILRLVGREEQAVSASGRVDAIVRANLPWFQDAQSRALSPRLAATCG